MNLGNNTTAAAVLLLALLVAAARRGDLLGLLGGGGVVDLGDGNEEQGQGGLALDVSGLLQTFDMGDIFMSTSATTIDTRAANIGAFLATIRQAEGTGGPNGYRMMFGGQLFEGWEDHPRRAVQFGPRRLWTSAAGAYQFMAISRLPGGGATKVDTWDRIRARLNLPDFSPTSQDRAAIELIQEAGALGDVQAGRFSDAVAKCRAIWASLPGAGYGQPEKSMAFLQGVYTQAGGTFA